MSEDNSKMAVLLDYLDHDEKHDRDFIFPKVYAWLASDSDLTQIVDDNGKHIYYHGIQIRTKLEGKENKVNAFVTKILPASKVKGVKIEDLKPLDMVGIWSPSKYDLFVYSNWKNILRCHRQKKAKKNKKQAKETK